MTHIKQRTDTAANWTAANPVLMSGEVGWESDTDKAKRGDGATAWNSLPYCIVYVPGVYAPLASPAFSGNPTAPTPTASDNDGSVATTKFVKDQGYATLDSPVLTGTPTAPSPATSDDSTKIATTEWVKDVAASLDSPVLTGNPTAPTPATSDNDTSIATTAFVKNQGYVAPAFQTLLPARVATTGSNITLSGTQTIDGVAVVAGDRVLVKDQTTTANNGVYVVAAGAWARATDADSVAEVQRGTQIAVLEGNIHKFKTFTQMVTVVTLGTTAQNWVVRSVIESGNVFQYPTPVDAGQVYWDSTNKVLAGWDSTQWVTLNSPLVCTSGTRPANPKADQIIYETDTGLLQMYVGGSWVPVGGGAIQTYTPTWTGATTNPVIGNGTIAGRYQVVGKQCHFRITITMGSTTTYGSGAYSVSLPIAPQASSSRQRIPVDLLDTSAGSALLGSALIFAGALTLWSPGTTAGGFDRQTTASVPFAFATTDVITIAGSYEIA